MNRPHRSLVLYLLQSRPLGGHQKPEKTWKLETASKSSPKRPVLEGLSPSRSSADTCQSFPPDFEYEYEEGMGAGTRISNRCSYSYSATRYPYSKHQDLLGPCYAETRNDRVACFKKWAADSSVVIPDELLLSLTLPQNLRASDKPLQLVPKPPHCRRLHLPPD